MFKLFPIILTQSQQLSEFKRKQPRIHPARRTKLFWVLIHRHFPSLLKYLVIVKPETVIRWHRLGFKALWKKKCKAGRPPIKTGLVRTIEKLAKENFLWGAPKIHGELLMLGFKISERTVSYYLKRFRPIDPLKSIGWSVFLKNQAKAIVAVDFFTIPTISMKVLYGFVVMSHDRREIIHFNVTYHPNAFWISQQFREAFPFECLYKYLIMDNDQLWSPLVIKTIEDIGLKPVHTTIRSPWQNGYCERTIGSIRRELLNHTIIISENHARKLLLEYQDYFNTKRTHLGLDKNCPTFREIDQQSKLKPKLNTKSWLSGLHHSYFWGSG